MKKLFVLGSVLFALTLSAGISRADVPTKQEGRVWVNLNALFLFSPNWSLTFMPGARGEFARSREDATGLHFLELFVGPNYTHRIGNLTLKGSLWYYYMGYPTRGRMALGSDGVTLGCSAPALTNPTTGLTTSDTCTSTYSFSHNLEIIPAAEYRFGRWSIYDRVIFHNTFYADVYSAATPTLSVSDQRWGWGTVMRELLQLRYAVTDRLGAFVMDEVFLGILEDSDASKMKKTNADGTTTPTGFKGPGYWKSGFRSNRVYLGVDYKVTPTFTVQPMYMLETMVNGIDSGDLTDVAHTFFLVATVVTNLFEKKQ
jgi:hypothetical protein